MSAFALKDRHCDLGVAVKRATLPQPMLNKVERFYQVKMDS
jgi:hypothetical protein